MINTIEKFDGWLIHQKYCSVTTKSGMNVCDSNCRNVFDGVISTALSQVRKEAYEEVISHIGHDRGWEESEDVYRRHFGLPSNKQL
jgi:hypothetical protein